MKQVKVPDPVHEAIGEKMEEGDFATYGEAVRAVFREVGYDV